MPQSASWVVPFIVVLLGMLLSPFVPALRERPHARDVLVGVAGATTALLMDGPPVSRIYIAAVALAAPFLFRLSERSSKARLERMSLSIGAVRSRKATVLLFMLYTAVIVLALAALVAGTWFYFVRLPHS